MNNKLRLGLSMIMKNESHVIIRCLTSVLPIIDYWVIVDTGSTDGSQDLVINFFKEHNIQGELIEAKWVDFSTARNIAREAVEPNVDFGIWIDCDEELIISPDFNKDNLLSYEIDSICIKTIYGNINYSRKNIWQSGMGYKWTGPIHELLDSPFEQTTKTAEGLTVIVRAEGSSWSDIKQKYTDHAIILEEYTKVNEDPRWIFYTAQSYRDASNFPKAIEWYEKRASILTGFKEEVYISKLMIAKLTEAQSADQATCMKLYLDAHACDQVRGEAIKSIITMCIRLKDYKSAYKYSLYGMRYNQRNPYPYRILFLDKGLYDYEMLELHAYSCYYNKVNVEGARTYWLMRDQLDKLGSDYLNADQMKIVLANESYYPRPIIPPVIKSRGSNNTPAKKKRKK